MKNIFVKHNKSHLCGMAASNLLKMKIIFFLLFRAHVGDLCMGRLVPWVEE